MTKATDFDVILNGARGATEFERGIEQAKGAAVSEEYGDDDNITALDFADGSRLMIDVPAMSAREA